MKSSWQRVIRNQDGGSLVEYGLLLALLASVCVAAITLTGGGVGIMLHTIAVAI